MKKKKRVDELLVERELVEDIEKARRSIMAGIVFTENERIDKPGTIISLETPLRVKQKDNPYVGRGGKKLDKALQEFDVDVSGKLFMDVGSSTGGFTDCALQHGAVKSYAIDVGYNQLDWKLRNDHRVIVMERTNFRDVTPDLLSEGLPNFVSIDVSFISLKHIFPVLNKILQPNSDIIALIKPQFEAKREQVGDRGIIRDPAVHYEVLDKVIVYARLSGFSLLNLTYSPITGTEGNIEFLVHLGWEKESNMEVSISYEHVIKEAHMNLS
ncbi:TlyA family RNA methyltransferase [Oceanobacillus sp. 1P07AA]|uniref:TlyA family RNA methyltransferase n=1 Tax=Oceanobacillus sp. 1P07AA TaxID=3132293 RepID=UPI0039A51C46